MKSSLVGDYFFFISLSMIFMMLTIHGVVLRGINVVSRSIGMVFMVCSQHGLCLVHAWVSLKFVWVGR